MKMNEMVIVVLLVSLTAACAVGPRWVSRTIVHKDEKTGDLFTDSQTGFVMLEPWEPTPDRAKAGRTAALTSPEVERMHIENQLRMRGGAEATAPAMSAGGKVTSFCDFSTKFKILNNRGSLVAYGELAPHEVAYLPPLPPGSYRFKGSRVRVGRMSWTDDQFTILPGEVFTRSLTPKN
ncbi:MAG: hypothetical protein COT39_03850 [Parcubacteria group bacterium CG08_land_8_20_14_0_20_48_21]|nr:MAG: hypothetical protein AUK21_01070 [Parcubacteria group bacterium CG2_30_48_51]PIS32564.1 MAG: hypothetical protein COT39_03850 [Parcubacteria group bacterium CG08_land_8_20_14_0_20_48_21]PIW78969.1 MAG: hypothetical protein COZ99_03510 [Parcubacteria group bacterium CG_4_8_14_3_um_filter_48_16]PIZ77225.1 MAG: hypothetical protein COY03_03585 [bacterium CG_4_10_14_0_2_um_filter_48_144]PJC39576.1 MAG: hypothetical protein CO043_03475 [Parcubacteria group bacterium CG_4_9_14_0_2_um_filter_4